MIVESLEKLYLWQVGFMVASLFLATVVVIAGEHERTILVLTYSLPMMKEECFTSPSLCQARRQT